MRRVSLTILVLALLGAFAATADAATIQAAKRAVQREVARKYSPALGTSVRCTRLTNTRFRCRWHAAEITRRNNGRPGCEARGQARARKFQYAWDVRLIDSEVYNCA